VSLLATARLALENLTTGLCLSMLGTNVWFVVGFGITGGLFVDGLLVSAHNGETPHPAGGHGIASHTAVGLTS
jgi:hypothetical protein